MEDQLLCLLITHLLLF